MQVSVKSTPSFKKIKMYIFGLTRSSSNSNVREMNFLKLPSKEIQSAINRLKSARTPIVKKFKDSSAMESSA